jgi:hypothetical protein
VSIPVKLQPYTENLLDEKPFPQARTHSCGAASSASYSVGQLGQASECETPPRWFGRKRVARPAVEHTAPVVNPTAWLHQLSRRLRAWVRPSHPKDIWLGSAESRREGRPRVPVR